MNTKNILAFAALTYFAFTACNKETVNTKDLQIYLPSGSVTFNTSNTSFLISRNRLLAGSFSVPVLLTRPFTQDVQVKATIDTGLLAAYDLMNKVTSLRPPAGAFQLGNNGMVNIKAGASSSADSIQLVIADLTKADPKKVYTVPVTLATAEGEAPTSENRKSMFINVSFQTISVAVSAFAGGNLVPVVISRTVEGDKFAAPAFRATINTPMPTDHKVSVVADDALVEAYNTKNGTSFLPFPAQSWSALQTSVTIPARAVVSADSFRIGLTNPAAYELDKKYLLPFSIKDEGAIEPNAAENIVYLSLSVKRQNIDPLNSGLAGTTINRTGWSVTAGAANIGAAAAAIDGKNETSWFTSGLSWLRIDMGAAKTVKGFSIVPNYMYGTNYNFLEMDVQSSDDGVTWKDQGSYTGSLPATGSTAASPDIKTVRFITPVAARYFRFNVTKNSGGYSAMGEVNGVE